MSKAKLIFLVLSVGYISIGFFNWFGIVDVSNIILFGLSLSALFASLSDTVTQLIIRNNQKNHMSFIAKYAIKFMNNKLDTGALQNPNSISIRNVKKNLESQNPHYEKSSHPTIYIEEKHIKILNILTYVFYVFSIISFIVPPFIKPDFSILDKVSILVAFFAFGIMCFNIFMSEVNADLSKRLFDFFNNTQPIINSVYPDFMGMLNSQLNYREDLLAAMEILDKEIAKDQTKADAEINKIVEEYNHGNN